MIFQEIIRLIYFYWCSFAYHVNYRFKVVKKQLYFFVSDFIFHEVVVAALKQLKKLFVTLPSIFNYRSVSNAALSVLNGAIESSMALVNILQRSQLYTYKILPERITALDSPKYSSVSFRSIMKLVIFFLLFRHCFTFDLPRERCRSDLKIDDDHYNVSKTYHTGDAYPADAHYDKYGNLFYVESSRNSEGFHFDIKMIKPQNNTAEKVPGLPAGLSYSIATDKKGENIYFGTGKGIYLYSYETKRAKLISDPNLKLNMIFVDKDGNKYITESYNGVEELYLLDGERKIRFKSLEALDEMAIDSDNNFYYIKAQKLFVLKSTLSTPVFISNVTYNGFAQISFYEERVFVASEKLVYTNLNKTDSLKTVNNTPGKITAIAFDKNGNFVLGTKGKMLKYNVNECNSSKK